MEGLAVLDLNEASPRLVFVVVLATWGFGIRCLDEESWTMTKTDSPVPSLLEAISFGPNEAD